MDMRDYDRFTAAWAPVLRDTPMALAVFQRACAVTARDKSGRYLYYESAEKAMWHLGYDPTNTFDKRAFRKHRTRLVEVGAWTVVRQPAPGRPTWYELADPSGEPRVPLMSNKYQRNSSDPNGGTVATPTGEPHDPPDSRTEERDLTGEEGQA